MSDRALRLLIVGEGRMGRLIASLALEHGCEVVATLDRANNVDASGITPELCRGIDVAMEFTQPDSAAANLAALARCRVHTVIGTTGWGGDEAALRRLADEHAIGVVAAANFSVGAHVLAAASERAASLLGQAGGYGAFIHEQHHAAINPIRTFVDQRFSRQVHARAGIVINTGEDNYLTTADAVEAAHTVTVSQFLNEYFAREAGLPDAQIGLGHAFEINPDLPDSFRLELAHAQLARELFPHAPLKWMPPTKHMTGNLPRLPAGRVLQPGRRDDRAVDPARGDDDRGA